jgi:tRNA C32,U32 (ribose-2'-O)-methylase TrmJ
MQVMVLTQQDSIDDVRFAVISSKLIDVVALRPRRRPITSRRRTPAPFQAQHVALVFGE